MEKGKNNSCFCHYPPKTYYEVETSVFSEGTIETINKKTELFDYESDVWHIIENDVECVCTEEEYESLNVGRKQGENHTHTLPYTCFYDMQPCTLEEMVNYLNAYASVMNDGQSVPVEIKKVETIKHEGTGIITKGEVPQWRVDNLEILRQYINGEQVIASGNADSVSYSTGFPERFYFGLEDINNDDVQEFLISYKDEYSGDMQIHFISSDNCLYNVYGVDNVNGTYLVSEGSVCLIEHLYTYDGTSFSVLGSLTGDWDDSEDGGPYEFTENGTTREISQEEFNAIRNDWESRHTSILDSADIHLDIKNIENTFGVKINTQNSGEWLVTNAE